MGFENEWGKLRDLPDWMSTIDEGVNITQLTIPGTHDSHCTAENTKGITASVSDKVPGIIRDVILHEGADRALDKYVVTQHWPVINQLYIGVRFLDLRVSAGTRYQMCHGVWLLKGDLDGVLGHIKTFLDQHPREVVLVSISYEPSDEPPEMDSNIAYMWSRHNWYRETRWPTLGEARGKAVLLRRFKGSAGIDFNGFYGTKSKDQWDQQDDGTSSEGDVSRDELWNRCHAQLDHSMASPFNDRKVHFTSLNYWKHDGPLENARFMNERLADYLTNKTNREIDPDKNRFGVIILDGITTPDVALIVYRNWHRRLFEPDQVLVDHTLPSSEQQIALFANGVHVLFQKDGNLVVYDRDNKPLWASHTTGRDAKYLKFTADDNLHMLAGDNRTKVWKATEKYGRNDHQCLYFMDRAPWIVIESKGGRWPLLWNTNA